MVSVTGAVGTVVESAQDAFGAFKVLRRSGLVDPTKPKELLTTVKRAKIIGPCAAAVAHGADEYPEAIVEQMREIFRAAAQGGGDAALAMRLRQFVGARQARQRRRL